MKYVQFYQLSLNYDGKHPSKPIPMLGSDGIYPIDGRYALRTIHDIGIIQAKRLNDQLNKGVIGFSIIPSLRTEPPNIPTYNVF